MIKVFAITNTSRKNDTFDPATSIRDILEHFDMDYTRTQISLDGTQLRAGDFDRPLSDYATDHCTLSAITKADNA
jgi:hypothetical protein